jgi:hypothetical protein
VPSTQSTAQAGDRAFLPCEVISTGSRDDIFLVLWFKDNATKPMYRWGFEPVSGCCISTVVSTTPEMEFLNGIFQTRFFLSGFLPFLVLWFKDNATKPMYRWGFEPVSGCCISTVVS